MYVTDIEITEIPVESGDLTNKSSVVFTSYERQIQVMCDIREAESHNPVKRRMAFVADALRQLKRMPEFRTGRAEIEFGPGLVPKGIL